jgi:hypothetical protein
MRLLGRDGVAIWNKRELCNSDCKLNGPRSNVALIAAKAG